MSFTDPLPARTGLCKEQPIRPVAVLALVLVAERFEKCLEVGHVLGRHFEAGEDAAEVGTVVAVVEQADVPSSAERFEEIDQRAGALGELEAAQLLVMDLRTWP